MGVNRVGTKISEKTGKEVAVLRGDVDFDAAKEIAGSITPVPGGVGTHDHHHAHGQHAQVLQVRERLGIDIPGEAPRGFSRFFPAMPLCRVRDGRTESGS